MTTIVITTWQCDGCMEISWRPAIELAYKIPYHHHGQNNFHLCKNCERTGLIICQLCNTVQLKYVPCYRPIPTPKLPMEVP